MAATESSPVADVSATSPVEETPKSIAKTEKMAKVEKPDDDKFKKDLAEAEKQLNSVTEKMVPPPIPKSLAIHLHDQRSTALDWRTLANVSPLYVSK
jgi:hypothetical protein